MHILALEPFYGGSHRAFLDGWSARSRHDWTVLGLPARKWKWRMRHAAITLVEMVEERRQQGQSWDLLFVSDMLNLAEFRGLAHEFVRQLAVVVYFHENQLTYPVQREHERDLHFALTNLTTALAADRVWFNSAFHREAFLNALGKLLRRMPDYRPMDAIDRIRRKSTVQSPGVDSFAPRGPRPPGPLRVLWAARWEYDKNPAVFFTALRLLKSRGISFRLSVIGERFREAPLEFAEVKQLFANEIDRWGHQEIRDQYVAALREADVFVSTANHEFFGIAVIEAIAAGVFPLLPQRLSYPEILDPLGAAAAEFFYDGRPESLAAKLELLATRLRHGDLWQGEPQTAARAVERYHWPNRVASMDERIESP